MVDNTVGTNSQSIENKQPYISSKTIFKTNARNEDDARVSETFLTMAKRLEAGVKKYQQRRLKT